MLNSIHAVEETKEKTIKITIDKVNEKTGRITISDTGKGMKQEELNHIFEPFSQIKKRASVWDLRYRIGLLKKITEISM